MRLRFPSLKEVMGGKAEPEETCEDVDTLPDLTPEELLQMRQDALNARKIEEFRTFCSKDAARLYLPDDDERYLDGLWEALQSASSSHIRIMH